MSVKLIKRGDTWVTEFLGRERHFVMDTDLVSWRSLGIIADSALMFVTDLSGRLETVTVLKTGEELVVLEIPKNHTVASQIRPTKLFINTGEV